MGERRRFYGTFLAGLHHENRAALHLVVDEADELAPSAPSRPDNRAARDGSDRPPRPRRLPGADDHPAARGAAQGCPEPAGCLIAMQLTAAQDRAAIGAWIEGQADRAEAKALLASLPQLRTGEGWLWWPPDRRSSDASRDPDPRHRQHPGPRRGRRRRTALRRRPRPRGPCAQRWRRRSPTSPAGTTARRDGAARRARPARARPGTRRARGVPGCHPAQRPAPHALAGEIVTSPTPGRRRGPVPVTAPPAPRRKARSTARRGRGRGRRSASSACWWRTAGQRRCVSGRRSLLSAKGGT